MIVPTPAVLFARRAAWQKAIAAARIPTTFCMKSDVAYAVELVIAEIVRAAEADGVIFDAEAPSDARV